MMTALSDLKKNLSRIRAAREQQARIVSDLTEPHRKLAELTEQERSTLAAIEAAAAELEQAKKELEDCERDLRDLEPNETKLAGAVEVLDWLAERAMHGFGNVRPSDVGRVAAECRSTLELLEMKRAERDRLDATIKRLGGK
jgi:chromosome segregation ATPase